MSSPEWSRGENAVDQMREQLLKYSAREPLVQEVIAKVVAWKASGLFTLDRERAEDALKQAARKLAEWKPT